MYRNLWDPELLASRDRVPKPYKFLNYKDGSMKYKLCSRPQANDVRKGTMHCNISENWQAIFCGRVSYK